MDMQSPSQACIKYNKTISHLEPKAKRRRRRPRNTWLRDLNADTKQIGAAGETRPEPRRLKVPGDLALIQLWFHVCK
ncbi:hypothetical protein DPMN_050038 [Dreissena polymorpha]|uniref:Uncharacterized protein n=1 Tax=Dreissena polymorpha TaxID=45954 RepID=A0A9D4HLV8_DREPO|nr:hypothetical protein DPMN_050038 [Dreissena polymorpha]